MAKGRLPKGKHFAPGFRRMKTPQEMERISEAFYYDMVISSGELKNLILHRIDELGVELPLVLKEAGITEHAFKTKYLRDPDPVSTPKLRQSHMIRLLEVLGIKAKMTFIVQTDLSKVDTEHLKYKKK